ncbi:helix-turn-helix domain-containing protein [Clostridium botulinum]|uniref:helix-turn-helix domain-containing protein n=1 Tax=Clostridium botulinum TaxID=1491 RepID=UPI000774A0B6|nr:helix-turn-helix transcriptional regulator [Clostridium botulinum]MBY6931885.1 helix-turn-helix transcriptional regulator [Clostridium botulinum]NFG20550.1 helix-turn-helix transcriptional regulator [Clostridium botulinum]NFO81108.1 helix-turn-helix transcriptional regulator [Clostridium botulinum]
MNIGDMIKKLRKDKGLTQKQLADAVNVSTITIQNYENNRRKPSIEMLEKISSALNVFIFNFNKEDNSLENPRYYLIEQYLRTIHCEFIFDEEDGYITFKCPDGEFEVSDEDIKNFNDNIKSYIQFQISEIIKNSRKIGK